MPRLRPSSGLALLPLVGLLAILGCTAASTPRPSPSASAAPSATTSPTVAPTPGVIAAPGSDSAVYPPNPGAIVVAIEPGHGGCLDWGVPNAFDNRVQNAEKTLTLAIATELRDRLEREGVSVVMIRESDDALAGDLYPELGCTQGADWRDVNQDGHAGFGRDVPEATRTRDELSARIDVANLARADLLVSIHINSLTQDGVVFAIAATQTYFCGAQPWSDGSAGAASAVQSAVVAALEPVAGYERQDRGTDGTQPCYYLLKPGDPDLSDPRNPRRGALMPAVLSEVASMSLEAESRLLATEQGQSAVADGLAAAIASWIGNRPLAVRYDALVPGGEAAAVPTAVPGDGPPFWPPVLGNPGDEGYVLPLRITNTGTQAWPSDASLRFAWTASDTPYLAGPPADLEALAVDVPPLRPGESLELSLSLPAPLAAGRHLAWIELAAAGSSLSELGSPALQLATQPGH